MKTSTLVIMKMSFLLLLVLFTKPSHSQVDTLRKTIRYFSGNLSITNNGISVIPTFTLGKPAGIFNIALGNNRLSFEPELRFSLEGKPWSILLWWRYKIANGNRFKFNMGAHPALVFRTTSTVTNGIQTNTIEAQRFLAAELSPNYFLTKNISIGLYYLYGHGIDDGSTKNTHFINFTSSFNNIKLTKQVLMRFSPQIYYLKMDKNDGVFFSSMLTLADKRFPFSISGFINKVIQTNISASQNIVWNTTLTYSFQHSYLKQR